MNLMESNDGFREKVEEVWGKIQEAFQPVVDIFMSFFEGFLTGSEETGGAMDMIMSIVSGASEFICAIIQWISKTTLHKNLRTYRFLRKGVKSFSIIYI